MRDKRPVDELSIEELERILAIRRREERLKRLKRLKTDGRVVEPELSTPKPAANPKAAESLPPMPVIPAPPTNSASAASVNAALPMPAGIPAVAPPPPPPNGDVTPRFEDEDEFASSGGAQRVPARTIPPALAPLEYPRTDDNSRALKRLVNGLLLLVEIAAVVGLVVIGVSLLEAQSNLQRETAEAQQFAEQQAAAAAPTIAPTPELTVVPVVLPGGHKPFQNLPNLEEIPTGISAQMQSVAYEQLIMPIPNRPQLRTPETARRIYISKINVDAPIVPGVDWDAMRSGVGRLINGTNPGDERGNLVLSAHNDIYGEIFRHLDQLEVGDRFIIETDTQVFTYEVTAQQIVEPTAVEVMQQTSTPTATLISCYPYQVNTHRIVVFARRVDN